MKFGSVAVGEAEGAMLAHATTVGGRRFRKAHRMTPDDIAFFRHAGVEEVVAAVLSAGDLDEDEAASHIAQAMRFPGIEVKPAATGRVNFHAAQTGIFTVDKGLVDRLNALDPAITLATVAEFRQVEKGGMVATVKIIPFAVAGKLIEKAAAILAGAEIFAVQSYRPLTIGMIQTVLPGLKESVLNKTVRITENRLARSGNKIDEERRTAHESGPLADALSTLVKTNDLIVIFGASALCDFGDVIPAAIRQAGGEVLRCGMPVDPGNLMVLGRLDGKYVIGAPGCARSPKENGFDWVLDRLVAGLDVTADDIAGMGVGGLLMEIPTRPQPREMPSVSHEAPISQQASVHAVVLAAGRSSRMGGPNKLMALFSGKPLIRRTVELAMASKASGTSVVTGHQAARIGEALDGLDIGLAHNPDFATGLAGSLKAGIAAVPEDASGALVLLGDMPAVSAVDIDRLIGAFRGTGGKAVIRATHNGKRGNPVILPRALFVEVSRLEGDTGARHLVEADLAPVVDIEIGEGASIDVDTREALERAGGVLQD